MALLARLFSPRKSYKKEKNFDSPGTSPLKSRSSGFFVDTNNVRILLFRECDWRGRKLLFDSTAVEKTPLDSKTPLVRPRCNSSDMVVEVSSGYSYKYKKPHTDTNTLGEMIFGSISMVTRGSSLKVHSMKDPARLMFTKIVQAPRSGVRKRQVSDDKSLEDCQSSSANSMGEFNSGSFGSKSGSFEATLDDSGFVSLPLSVDWPKHVSPQHCGCSSCPLHPSGMSLGSDNSDRGNSSSSLQSGGSLSSMRRRWVRSVATSLNIDDPAQAVMPTGKRTKLGIALIIPLFHSNSQEMEQFLLNRLPMVNNILNRLQHSTEQAYCRREVFVQSMYQASRHATQSVCSLVGGPRLDHPLWLVMTEDKTDTTTRNESEKGLVSDLNQLLTTLDTKDTNFFISTLLTAVLTHHLGWVPTVMPDMTYHSEALLSEFSRNHPYNPLWAQLSDLQGALGYPPKVARTVVVGKSEAVVVQLLSVLSYFIRCGHVKTRELERETAPDEENLLQDLQDDKNEKFFDKEAIREFSKAGSLDGTVSSSSTLTKSKTVLSMKTFSVIDNDLDNANSLESGFESCNEFSGESYEDGNRILKSMQGLNSKMGKTKSSSNLMETSFFENKTAELNLKCDDGMKMSLESPESSFVKCIETNVNNISKVESEKQFTSPYVLDILNKTNSKHLLGCSDFKSTSFIKENLIQPEFKGAEDKTNKVVFVLGENEQLVNIKGQDEANIPETCVGLPSYQSKESYLCPPIILVNDTDAEYFSEPNEERETKKADFIAGNISNRVVISHSTCIQLDDTKESETLRPLQRQRCLSAPEEVVIKSDWVEKRRKSKEMINIIRKWLSDSAIQRTSSKTLHCIGSSENIVSSIRESVLANVGVFRTNSRTMKDTVIEPYQSVENIVSDRGCESISHRGVSSIVSSSTSDRCIELPFQSCVVEDRSMPVDVVASMFGSISNHYSPELVLQGLSRVSPGWLTDLKHSLVLEAHNIDMGENGTEAVCIVANVDSCEVQLVSSHSVRSVPGVRVGMSQLVANMLESTHHLCSLSLPPSVCLSHVETKLQEMCVRSQALAELLLSSEFLDMVTLTSTLDLDPNDVPLLLSVASAHTPSVTRKYGLSYQ